MYTGSLCAGLASLMSFTSSEDLMNKRISMFACGGGSAAGFYTMFVKGDEQNQRENELRTSFQVGSYNDYFMPRFC